MSTIKSSSEDLTLNADGSGKDIKFQSNGVEKASISSAGALTAISTINAGSAGSSGGVRGKINFGGVSAVADGFTITNQNGNYLDIKPNSTNSGIKILNSGGLCFGTDTATANALDDYEEGSWTPILHGATTTTYTEQGGVYTRIGRFVFFTGVIIVNSVGDGSTYIIGGLPFSASSPGTTNLLPGGILVQYHDTLATSVVEFSADVTRGASTVLMRSKTAAAANPSTNALMQNSGRVNCSGFYQV